MKKTILTILCSSAILTACKKSEPIPFEHQSFTVEGYYLSYDGETPRAHKLVVLSEGKDFQTHEPVRTEADGYFKITYTSKTASKYISLHSYLNDYDCVTPDVYLLQNLPKGQNLNVGKVSK